MGDWNTLHLLDEKKFKAVTLKLLKNTDLLSEYFSNYKRDCVPNECKWTPSLIASTINSNQWVFEDISNINRIINERTWTLPKGLNDYHLRQFITYVTFKSSAEYYPYFRLGKSGVLHCTKYEAKTLSGEILEHLFKYHGVLNADGDGIRKIIKNEDLSFLLSDLENVSSKNEECKSLIQEFFDFLEFAHSKGLAVLSGQDIYDYPFRNDNNSLHHGIKTLSNLIFYQDTDSIETK
jgi:hypothetical protein